MRANNTKGVRVVFTGEWWRLIEGFGGVVGSENGEMVREFVEKFLSP
jgi:hypothetical protein